MKYLSAFLLFFIVSCGSDGNKSSSSDSNPRDQSNQDVTPTVVNDDATKLLGKYHFPATIVEGINNALSGVYFSDMYVSFTANTMTYGAICNTTFGDKELFVSSSYTGTGSSITVHDSDFSFYEINDLYCELEISPETNDYRINANDDLVMSAEGLDFVFKRIY